MFVVQVEYKYQMGEMAGWIERYPVDTLEEAEEIASRYCSSFVVTIKEIVEVQIWCSES